MQNGRLSQSDSHIRGSSGDNISFSFQTTDASTKQYEPLDFDLVVITFRLYWPLSRSRRPDRVSKNSRCCDYGLFLVAITNPDWYMNDKVSWEAMKKSTHGTVEVLTWHWRCQQLHSVSQSVFFLLRWRNLPYIGLQVKFLSEFRTKNV